MNKSMAIIASLLSIAGAVEAADAGYRVAASLTPADGMAKSGDTVKCQIQLTKGGKPVTEEKLRCRVKWEGNVVETRDVQDHSVPTVMSYRSDKPGWVYFDFQVIDNAGNVVEFPGNQILQGPKKKLLVYEIGALFDAEKIVPQQDAFPADMREFWASERARLRALPTDMVLTPHEPPKAFADKVDCFRFRLNCLGISPVHGYMAIPKAAKPGKHGIIIDYLSMVHGDSSPDVPSRMAAQWNMIAMYVNWHGCEAGHPAEWYPDEIKKTYFNNGRQFIENPRKWYFHDMYLRVLRAVDYMKSRPEWDGKTLIVRGGSLGGIQTIVAAALEPAVSAAVISVPTGCEFAALKAGRMPPWTMCGRDKQQILSAVVQKTLGYHDGVNLATMITCPTYVCTGFADETCFPSSVYAFYNALPKTTKKYMVTQPHTGHFGTTLNTLGDKYINSLK